MVTQGDMQGMYSGPDEEGEAEGQPVALRHPTDEEVEAAEEAGAELPHNDEFEGQPCSECNAQVGQIHELGCDMERCPFCGGQLLSCNCAYDKLGLKDQLIPGTELYEKGLSPTQEHEWKQILEKKGRIPHVNEPNICHLCSQKWPKMFMVPDEEWSKHVPPNIQDKMLCRSCYDELKTRMPQGWRRAPTAGLRVVVEPGAVKGPAVPKTETQPRIQSKVPKSWQKVAERVLGGTQQ